MSISLTKGGTLSLKKDDGGELTRVRMGLGWDQAKKGGFFGGLTGGSIDLDASALLFDANRNLVDYVAFNHLRSKDGSVSHGGDNLTGAGDGDDETIDVDLSRVPANVTAIAFVITSYSGQAFDKIQNVFCRLVDLSAGQKEVVKYQLGSEQGNSNAQVMAVVARSGSGWTFRAIGESSKGKVAKDMVKVSASVL
jgi:tellurium resistance protein TerZ